MYTAKIFEENNNGVDDLQNRINIFFEENNIKIVDVKMCVETVTGIDYKSILIIYETM